MTATNPVKERCGAKTRKGTPCGLPAGHGTTHAGVGRCRRHGGASPQAEVAGQVILARREALAMGCPLDISGQDAILECIRIAAGEVRYASERIAELDTGEVVGHPLVRTVRPLKEEKGAENSDVRVEELRHDAPALHIWIVARHQAMDRLVAYSAAALKANIDERRVRLAERQGHLLAQVIQGVLRDLGVADRPEAPAIVRKHLTLVAGD